MKNKKILKYALGITLAMASVPLAVHADSATTSGVGYNVTASITHDVFSGSITGKYSNGGSVTIYGYYYNANFEVSPMVSRTGSPSARYSVQELRPFHNVKAHRWYKGYAKGFPSSNGQKVSTRYVYA